MASISIIHYRFKVRYTSDPLIRLHLRIHLFLLNHLLTSIVSNSFISVPLLIISFISIFLSFIASIPMYRFIQSQKEQGTVHFEGPVLPLFELKRAIANQSKLLGSKQDFDLVITNSETGEGTLDLLFPYPFLTL